MPTNPRILYIEARRQGRDSDAIFARQDVLYCERSIRVRPGRLRRLDVRRPDCSAAGRRQLHVQAIQRLGCASSLPIQSQMSRHLDSGADCHDNAIYIGIADADASLAGGSDKLLSSGSISDDQSCCPSRNNRGDGRWRWNPRHRNFNDDLVISGRHITQLERATGGSKVLCAAPPAGSADACSREEPDCCGWRRLSSLIDHSSANSPWLLPFQFEIDTGEFTAGLNLDRGSLSRIRSVGVIRREDALARNFVGTAGAQTRTSPRRRG